VRGEKPSDAHLLLLRHLLLQIRILLGESYGVESSAVKAAKPPTCVLHLRSVHCLALRLRLRLRVVLLVNVMCDTAGNYLFPKQWSALSKGPIPHRGAEDWSTDEHDCLRCSCSDLKKQSAVARPRKKQM
jgi:hypothetical protein